ncbi:hypothetical protein BKA69DRAFT_817283 [Paraphysoderma sedebokerense]|nr:hypothetical protein BKA69DRAFT_815832 [Paraphysoderma sedebokerense]KAI9138199.1 hypothetical protein BKA69DRAFT_817283 [Paraphysoderma sedebokerense]
MINIQGFYSEIVTTHGYTSHLRRCGPYVIQNVEKLDSSFSSMQYSESAQIADNLFKYAVEKLHSVPYKEVNSCWRVLLTYATMMNVLFAISDLNTGDSNQTVSLPVDDLTRYKMWRLCLEKLDLCGIISGAPLWKKTIDRLTSQIHAKLNCHPILPLKRKYTDSIEQQFELSIPTPIPSISRPVPRLQSSMSLLEFSRHVAIYNTPIIIPGSISHWPAFTTRKWSLDYFKSIAGKRIVPVEVGSQYTDENWTQRLMRLEDFIDTLVSNSTSLYHNLNHSSQKKPADQFPASTSNCSKSLAYLAQHDLFSQIPLLRNDIAIPDYCYCIPLSAASNSTLTSTNSVSDSDSDVERDVRLNAWFGPASTITPLHHDGRNHNLYAQVIGTKYVRLYSPEETDKMYPYEEASSLMTNTSQVLQFVPKKKILESLTDFG